MAPQPTARSTVTRYEKGAAAVGEMFRLAALHARLGSGAMTIAVEQNQPPHLDLRRPTGRFGLGLN